MVKVKKGSKIGMAKNVLCTVVNLAAGNLKRDIRDFQKVFPGKYTEETSTALEAEAGVVAKLPDPKTRRGDANQKLEALKSKVAETVAELRIGGNYIRQAFPKDVVETRLKEAGLTTENFRGIAEYNWDITTTTFNAFFNFLAQHEKTLRDNGFMPTAFPAEYAMLNVEYGNDFKAYKNAQKAFEEESASIADQVDALHGKLADLLKNGLSIYRKDTLKHKDYVLVSLKRAAAPKSGGGIRGGCVDDSNDRNIENARISVKHFDKFVLSKITGRWELKPLPDGIYEVTIEAKGYETVVLEGVKVRSGITTSLKVIRMKRVAVPA